ncbi:MAG: tripartite tricarboxylate transporter substrate binding protein [Rectinemataceae bacterium]
MKSLRSAFLVLLIVVTVAGTAFAQFPNKPLNYVVAFNPGGESDIFARAQQPLLEKILGQKVIVSYKIGGGGGVGWTDLLKQKPDGYTFTGHNLPHIILQPLTSPNTGYKTLDIVPVYTFMSTPCILAVSVKSPFKTVDDLVKFAKANPGATLIGGSASASANEIATIMFNKLTGIKTTYIPFTGSGDAMPALLGGHVSALMTYTTMGTQYASEMRVLAVATPERVKSLPDAPTFRELGIDLVEGAYRGAAVPPKTPEAIKNILADAFEKVNKDPEFAKRMEAAGFNLEFYGPRASEALVAEKIIAYSPLVKEFGK